MSRKSTKLVGVLAAAAMMLSTAVTALAQSTGSSSADGEQTNAQSADATQGQNGQRPGDNGSSNDAQQQSTGKLSQSNDKKGDAGAAGQSGSADAEVKKDVAPAAQANGPVQRQQPTVGQQSAIGPQATCPGGTWGTASYTCEVNSDSTYTLHVGAGTLGVNTHKSGDWYLMSEVLTNVSKVVFDDPSNTHLPADSAGLFGYDKYNGWGPSQNLLTEIVGIGDVDTSQVTDMTSMFRGATHLTSLDLHKWDVSHVRFMYYMFDRDSQLTAVGDIGNWNVSQVGNMEGMFRYDSSLQNLDLSNWQTSKLYDMNYLFSFAKSLTSVGDLSGWDVSHVRDMFNVFSYMDALESLDLHGWDVSHVDPSWSYGMDSMFTNDRALRSLDVRGWDTSRITTMKYMFEQDRHLATIRGIGDWNVSHLREADEMFREVGRDVPGEPTWAAEIAKWDVSSLTSAPGMFEWTNLIKLDLSHWNTRSLTDGWGMFSTPKEIAYSDADRTDGIHDLVLGPDTLIKADFFSSNQATGQPTVNEDLGYSGQWVLTQGVGETEDWHGDRSNHDASGQLAARTQSGNPFAGEYQWERSYTLEFVANVPDGSNASGMPNRQTSYGTDDTEEVDLTFGSGPTNENYTFTGWKDDDGNVYPPANHPYTQSLTLKAGVNHLTAQWQRKQVPVQYKLTLEKNGKPGAVIDGDTITLSSTTTDTSHTFTLSNDDVYSDTSGFHQFVCWSTESDGTGINYHIGDPVTLSSGKPTLTLYAQWSTRYKLSMAAHAPEAGITVKQDETYTGNPSFFVSASPAIGWAIPANLNTIFTLHDDTGADVTSDFEFTGWTYDEEGNDKVTGNAESSETNPNTTIYAQWKRVRAKKQYIYSLEFDTNLSGGTLSKTFPTVTSGPNKVADMTYALTIPSEYTVDHDDSNGHVFHGWTDKDGHTYQAGDTVNLTSDHTKVKLYGIWTARPSHITPITGPSIPQQPSPVAPLPPAGPSQPSEPADPEKPTQPAGSTKPTTSKTPAKPKAPSKDRQSVIANNNAKSTSSAVPTQAVPVPVPVFRANAPTIVTVPRVASRATTPQTASRAAAPVVPQQRNQAAPRRHNPCVSGDKRANTAAFIMQASGNVNLAGNDICGGEEALPASPALIRPAFPWWIFLVLALVLAVVVYICREKMVYAQHRSEVCDR
ncbi:BspA family leucine-rich repeat surface protein [Bifidobacterium sp. ESL0769]|uniref:BspA family leucine-rich repeat surface protein n=1 Tax=Bifidobacterium sp. ESL0769 TaxID=2983229 RepID=UPI0023F8DEA7|nr:BspA family leucine-rich repeat surface protein [Bifidobacterium sp. ESL0769]WEV67330.1 BspA family leucine-rich repeat surface protein [Bifidobacterium sp. ESL0769]